MSNNDKIVGFKGFNNKLQCTPDGKCFQYTVGETYSEPSMSMCNYGFHYCENPFNVWDFYPIIDSRFCVVSSNPKNTEKDNEGIKSVTTSITIEKELSLKEFINECINFALKNTKDEKIQSSSGDDSKLASGGDFSKLASSGDDSKLASSGDFSKLASSGDCSKLASSGDYSEVSSTGKDSVLAAIGINSKAKGIIGNWITLSEYKNNVVYWITTKKVDGKRIKENTWYTLKNKKFVEVI